MAEEKINGYKGQVATEAPEKEDLVTWLEIEAKLQGAAEYTRVKKAEKALVDHSFRTFPWKE